MTETCTCPENGKSSACPTHGDRHLSNDREMLPEVLDALRGSIRKWERIATGKGTDKGADNCPLCEIFINTRGSCKGCPVQQKVDKTHCVGTPYMHWHMINPWPEDINGRKATTSAHRKAALAEVEFLKSLLPENAT